MRHRCNGHTSSSKSLQTSSRRRKRRHPAVAVTGSPLSADVVAHSPWRGRAGAMVEGSDAMSKRAVARSWEGTHPSVPCVHNSPRRHAQNHTSEGSLYWLGSIVDKCCRHLLYSAGSCSATYTRGWLFRNVRTRPMAPETQLDGQ